MRPERESKVMYMELATIKDKDQITGFVVYDGSRTFIMDMDTMKKEAAAGKVDTLFYRDGQFIPILQGPIAKELKKKFCLKKTRKMNDSMTFQDFMNNDCLFRKEDVDLMMGNRDVILAEICLAFGRMPNYMMIMTFWSMHKEAVDKLHGTLEEYSPYIPTIRKGRVHDGFFTTNLPFTNEKCGFDLISFQEKSGLNFIYNPQSLRNMAERTQRASESIPVFGKLYRMMSPSEKDVNILFSVEREANRLSCVDLANRGIIYRFEKEL